MIQRLRGMLMFSLPLLPVLLSAQLVAAQTPEFPKGYFDSPMKVPLEVSGTFCELRSNHFHFGMDFRTAGMEGLPLYSAAEGYVYRIKVSYFGYGKAVYIKHPNGYITLYGHLKDFSPKIKARVMQEQARQQNFEFDLILEKDEIKLDKGELIAYSGNTGSSQGAHLHFEIRDSTSTISYNPLLFGLKVTDTKKPVFTGISIYELQSSGSFVRKDHPVKTGNTGYYFPNGSTISAGGVIRIGFQASDKQDATNYRNGIYRVEMFVDEQKKFDLTFDRMAFDDSRYINSYTDFKEYMKSKTFIQRCFIEPCNRLYNNNRLLGDGDIIAEAGKTYQVRLVAYDAAGNASTLNFAIAGKNGADYDIGIADPQSYVYCDKTAVIERDFVKMEFPVVSVYNSMEISPVKGSTLNTWGYPDYYLGDPYVPIHKKIRISLKLNATNGVDPSKLGLVYTNPVGKKNFYGGTVSNGWLSCETNDLGTYTIMADTTRPVISGLPGESRIRAGASVKFTITDDFSGIVDYDIYVDDAWILGEYEWKTKTVTVAPFSLSPGWHTWKVVVKDKRDNVAERTFRYYQE